MYMMAIGWSGRSLGSSTSGQRMTYWKKLSTSV
jgi:hypothetical protein